MAQILRDPERTTVEVPNALETNRIDVGKQNGRNLPFEKQRRI
jgi:hypothetical protein